MTENTIRRGGGASARRVAVCAAAVGVALLLLASPAAADHFVTVSETRRDTAVDPAATNPYSTVQGRFINCSTQAASVLTTANVGLPAGVTRSRTTTSVANTGGTTTFTYTDTYTEYKGCSFVGTIRATFDASENPVGNIHVSAKVSWVVRTGPHPPQQPTETDTPTDTPRRTRCACTEAVAAAGLCSPHCSIIPSCSGG